MVLQNRWKVQGGYLVYYGMRKVPYTNVNRIKLTAKQESILCKDNIPSNSEPIKAFIEQGIVVEKSSLRQTPKSIDEATFCVKCVANDFIIAGIEFDEDGLCPMCAASKRDSELISVLPVQNIIPRSKNNRFDAAVFYTGGKDSTYVLYYLAKVLKLRVLALTWEIPFLSDSARKSIENAKKHFNNVEFITRTILADDLNKAYKKLIALQKNTCACPSLAYAIFYPLLCQERIPYLILGNEPVQMKQLYYNSFAPRIAFRPKQLRIVHNTLNVLRLFLLKKPLRSGQREMLMLVKRLARGKSTLKRTTGYKNELVDNVCDAMDEMPNLKRMLKKTIRFSDRAARMPSLVHLDLNTISGGKYDWHKIKELLSSECGWVQPSSKTKSLHTSCFIEAVKDYSQFIRFYNMETTMIPFSALEISLACGEGNVTREAAMQEIKLSCGFSFKEPREYSLMTSCNGCPVGEM